MQKQPVGSIFFSEIRTPYGLCANSAGVLCYAVRRANISKNCYTHSLWLLQNGKNIKLSVPVNFNGHWWLNDNILLIATPGTAKDKRRTKSGLPFTSIKKLSTETGAKPQEFFKIYADVQHVIPLENGDMLILAAWQEKAEKALDETCGDADKAANLLEKWAAYEVTDEAPIWQNDKGITPGARQRLYLWQRGQLQTLTDENTDVETVSLSTNGKYALCACKTYTGLVPAGDTLVCVDVYTKEVRQIETPGLHAHFFCTGITALPNENFLFAGSCGKEYGINQNPTFYKLSTNNWEISVLNDERLYSCMQSVICDINPPSEMCWFYKNGKTYFASTVGNSCELLSINIESGKIEKETCGNGIVFEACEAGGEIYLSAMCAQSPAEIYNLMYSKRMRLLTKLNTNLQTQFAIQIPKHIECVNQMKHLVHGWVLMPQKSAIEQRIPAVLMLHGGPKAVYSTALFAEMQMLASHGYAVLFCNPRGSDGYGDAFADIRGDYAEKASEDVLLFLDEMLRRFEIIDTGRIAVSGGSYGGFLVNWLIGHTNRFKAAISERCITNWASMALLSDIGYFFVPNQIKADMWENPGALWDASPLKYVPNVRTPTLFIHSSEDYRCPVGEGLQMYTALKLYGVPARLCLFYGESHGLWQSGKPQNRVKRLEEICAWLQEWLK